MIQSALLLLLPVSPDVTSVPVNVIPDGGRTLVARADGRPAVEVASGASQAQLLRFDQGEEVVLWTDSDGGQSYRLALRADGQFSRIRPVEPLVHMRRGAHDPRVAPLEPIPGLSAHGALYVVQFATQSIEPYRRELRALGAEVRSFLPEAAHIVRMEADVADAVAALPFVRAVAPYTVADRVDPLLLEGFSGELRVHVQVFERGVEMKRRVADATEALGGEVVWFIDEGFRFDAMLDADQIRAVAALDDVLWMDPWSAPEEDMDKVRIDGGANSLETLTGFTGQGVRAEACDGNVDATHPDLQGNPVIFHGPASGSAGHGTPVTGIVFGDGAAQASRRGLLPDGQPIFADYGFLNNRYAHTAELLSAPYTAVFQTNSWGGARTREYTSTSMEMDDILFDHDIVILQSQSNAGNQDSRPQAWAKNIVSVGGIRHYNTQTLSDDAWAGAGSTGPAADGRLKPDLCYWYESIETTAAGGGTSQFGGTSAATPITAGYFGLFFQMWHAGLFNNAVGATVFESRPKATLARAFMINTAAQYGFSGASADLRRTTQGWGRANVQRLYDARDEIFFVNEDYTLAETESIAFPVVVEPGTPELAVTMVYLDAAGTTSATVHRINDLSLRVTDPSGATTYWGNNGLAAGNWSTSGGTSNTRDVVENVFVQNPAPGTWTVEVFADDINADAHVETPALDADFALVVRGTSTNGPEPCLPPSIYCVASPNSADPAGARVVFFGSNSVAANDLAVYAYGFPQNTFCLVARSDVQAAAFLGAGTLCLGNPLIRMQLLQADTFGTIFFGIDASAAAVGGAVVPGETWNYQVWYRDGATSNLSEAFRVTWCE